MLVLLQIYSIKKGDFGFKNVHFLDRKAFAHKKSGIRFLGCTLWTKISEQKKKIIAHSLNDYRHIQYNPDEVITWEKLEKQKEKKKFPPITPDITNKLHDLDVKFLREQLEIAKTNKETCVILSHHAPLYESCLKKEDEYIGEGFGNKDIFDIVADPVVQLCCYGHTHASKYFRYKETVIYSNQFGYAFNNEQTGFKNDQYVSLVPKESVWRKLFRL